jgi:methionyl aminopeptidase
VYDKEKISKMQKAADILSEILREVASNAKEGVSLLELDHLAEELCRKNNVEPAFKGYEGFPATLCTGVNDVVVHGIPDEYVLEAGDIVTVTIGEVDKETKRLLEATKNAVLAGTKMAKPGNRTGDIGNAMQKVVEKEGFTVVREMTGHGIGYKLHEDPYIPGFGEPGTGDILEKGEVIAIEAIVNQGSREIVISREDRWTTFTKDGMLSALFEHTVVVDENPVILTKW